ncbi:pentapeptide repeat-containing protein [Thiothrix winogradskyi]|uniref:Pentapeptide repeat-containing protein n=1 Tax=Thiothrix winogradskyi TaxID=96472 RepID=A0ABY3SXX0_9GAMM|nr:pentapeptide repeat-containing protein [Thiothrix winogradskyi]UJS23570.1 pentapeptide repeat-containing protein [Thiothrix winogradskyi]
MLQNSGRIIETDKRFSSNIESESFLNNLFVRLVAKKIQFTNVDFRYCIFDACYLRNCTFDSCDFTGCKFVGSNLLGTNFSGCKFDYATFERTQLDDDILDNSCPSSENLKLKFARSLRMNFQQQGNAQAANKAISIELEATEVHLKKAWASKESYYRKKYKGFKRLKTFIEWLEFRLLDLIWGNGESTIKLIRAIIVILIGITVIDVFSTGNINNISDYINSFIKSPQILLGVLNPTYYSSALLAFILFLRLVMFGFFMSIIIKRFNRR